MDSLLVPVSTTALPPHVTITHHNEAVWAFLEVSLYTSLVHVAVHTTRNHYMGQRAIGETVESTRKYINDRQPGAR